MLTRLTRSSSRYFSHIVLPPQLPFNSYTADPLLPRLINLIYTQHNITSLKVSEDLTNFGSRYRELYDLSILCEANPPRLERLDGWGTRTDKVITCEAWKKIHDISAIEGLVAIGQENEQLCQVHKSVKLHLFCAVGGMVGCPLAMTDGAATILNKLLKSTPQTESGVGSKEWRDVLESTVLMLSSRNPDTFGTSGQWMTEQKGGADIRGSTETYAVENSDGSHSLFGNKFYTSAIDSNVSLALARYKNNLSLFLIQLPDTYNGTIQIEKLKNKLGTRQLPTAELTLDGAPALLLAERGIANIVPILQVTRLYNCITAASYLRHITTLARSYATTRTAFGTTLDQLPLHKLSLARLETVSRAITAQTIDLTVVLNTEETPSISMSVSRVLSSVIKLHTALVSVNAIREGLECFGGAGYMEDTGLPGILRDACVLPVWEGTTDVLAAETMRTLQKKDALVDTLKYISELNNGMCGLGGVRYTNFDKCPLQIESVTKTLNTYIYRIEMMSGVSPMLGRSVAIAIGAAHAGAVLVSVARHTKDPSDIAAASLWCNIGLTQIVEIDETDVAEVLK